MRYRGHYAGAVGVFPSFGIIVDDQTMTWTTDPQGNDIPEPMMGVPFTREGSSPIGSGRAFDLFPGGKARPSK
jgi:hypothetical protein